MQILFLSFQIEIKNLEQQYCYYKDNSIYNRNFKHALFDLFRVTFQGRAFFDMVCPPGYRISEKRIVVIPFMKEIDP